MKKKLFAIIACCISIILGASVMSGCKLITTNNDADLNQVVLEVQISEDMPKDEVKKSDMIMAYLDYGYYYVYYYGYTNAQAFETILTSLQNTRILYQAGMKELEEDEGVTKDTSKTIYTPERYLSASEILDAKYNTYKAINDYIDSMVNDKENVSDTYAGDTRDVPNGATADTKIADDIKQAYIEAGFHDGTTASGIDAAVRNGYNKFINTLKTNSLLGEDYEDSIEQTIYYKNTLKTNEENAVITKFENQIKFNARLGVPFSGESSLSSVYSDMYLAQKGSYTGEVENFASALSAATVSNPIVYSPYTGYVYVYNLLLGINDEQTESIKNLTSTDETRKSDRRNVLEATIIKDLRSSWIYSGYDMNYDETNNTVSFKNAYSFIKGSTEYVKQNALPFQGKVTRLVEEDVNKNVKAEYRIDSVTEFTLDTFTDMMETYLYGSTQSGMDISALGKEYRKIVNSNQVIENYDAKINELLMAFSTDDGSLNTYKGYVVSPTPSISETESYMEEFASAGRLFNDQALSLGNSTYIMVATDYGYHVMFFAQKVNADLNYETLQQYLKYVTGLDKTESEWQTYIEDMIANWEEADSTSFLYQFIDNASKASDVLSNKETKLINQYSKDGKSVKTYESRYADLIK